MTSATKVKKKPTIWKLTQSDYLQLLENIDKNAKTILSLTHEVNRLKGRMGLGVGIWINNLKI